MLNLLGHESKLSYAQEINDGHSADPHSNTGSDSQLGAASERCVQARIDHLTLLWDGSGTDELHGVIFRFLGIEFDRVNHIPRKIGVWWDRCYRANTNAIFSERDGSLGAIHCRLSISGEDCGRVGNAKLRGFMIWAYRNLRNLRCSRVDLAIDDFSQHLNLEQMEAEIREGNYSGFKVAKVIENFGEIYHGWCVYMGARSGEKMIRAYNKEAESKGEIKSRRWEPEYKGDTANSVFLMILEFPEDDEEYQRAIINVAVSGVSFIEKNDKNLSRNTLVKWWSDWLEYLRSCPIKPKVARIKTSIEKKKAWIRRAVSKSLAMIQDVLEIGEFQSYLHSIIVDARLRYEEIDLVLMRDYQRYRHLLDEVGMIETCIVSI
jgi:DNA relaxase NicK